MIMTERRASSTNVIYRNYDIFLPSLTIDINAFEIFQVDNMPAENEHRQVVDLRTVAHVDA